jgi:hypothetical protein
MLFFASISGVLHGFGGKNLLLREPFLAQLMTKFGQWRVSEQK